jgi:hypothetical protein
MKANQNIAVAGQVPATASNPLGIAALDPKAISDMPLAQYYNLAGNFVNVQNACYYDTAVYTAGTAITAGQPARLFTKGKSQDSAVVNTGVAIPEKGEYMTNMIGDGEFEGGTTFLLEKICVDFFLGANAPTTLGTRGEVTAPNYTASVVIDASNHYRAIRDQFELQYLRNEEIKLRGLLFEFPSEFGASGAFGSPNGGFIQNGNGPGWNKLSRVPVLQSEDRFSFVLQPTVATWTPTLSFNIRVCLIGKTIKTFVP